MLYYLSIFDDPDSSLLAKTGACVGGGLSALWTRETYWKTILTLLAAKGVDKILAAMECNVEVQFGANANQAYHAFRHIAKMGLDKAKVQKAVTASVRELAKQIEPGKPFMQTITVDGHKLQYTAYLLRDGLINVGRIHGVP